MLAQWRETRFLQDQIDLATKNWLLQLMACIDRLGAPTFTLDQCYQFENELAASFPENRHIKAKIRQKLQVLRDKGYLVFLGRGVYRRTGSLG